MNHGMAGTHTNHSQPRLTPQPVELIWFLQPQVYEPIWTDIHMNPYQMGSYVCPYGLYMYSIHAFALYWLLRISSLIQSSIPKEQDSPQIFCIMQPQTECGVYVMASSLKKAAWVLPVKRWSSGCQAGLKGMRPGKGSTSRQIAAHSMNIFQEQWKLYPVSLYSGKSIAEIKFKVFV